MKNKNWFELFWSVVFLVVLIVVLNPWGVFMTPYVVMSLMCGLLLVFFVFAVFVFKEKAVDEREQAHRMLAGRMAFLVGAGVLVLGIVIQELRGALDPWLVYALLAMVLAKVLALKYSERRW